MLRASGATINETCGHGRQRAAGTSGDGVHTYGDIIVRRKS